MRIVVVLALPREAASVPLARHTATAALVRAGVTRECADEVAVALSEACTNAYRHAQSGDTFEVVLNVGDDDLVVDVMDDGTGVVQPAVPIMMPSPSAVGGRGVSLMSAFTDQVVFESVTGHGGWVRLRKRLRWVEDAPYHGRRDPARYRLRSVRQRSETG
jgi:serine/threonine-protein kinase RsbW